MINGSKTLEDIRKLDSSQLDPKTFMDLSGFKDWTYTIEVAKQLIRDIEDGSDMCKETILWAFDYATTKWEFDRGCYEILAHAWLD